MRIGIEVECIFNCGKISLSVGSYHKGKHIKGTHWEAQNDGSLNYSNKFAKERTVELVSSLLKNKTQFKEAMKDFKTIFKINKSNDLKKRIYFNKSCGCHIHVSFKKYTFWQYVHPNILLKTRKYFLKHLVRSNLRSKLKESVLTQYDRNYAKIMPKQMIRQLYSKNVEFNFCSERSNMGLEWRGFNLNGVETYKEFKYLLTLAYRTMRYLEKQINEWNDMEINHIKIEYKNKHYQENINIKHNSDTEEIIVKSKKISESYVGITPAGISNPFATRFMPAYIRGNSDV